MSIIRGASLELSPLLLSPAGELLPSAPERPTDFLEAECHASFQKGHALGERIGYEKAYHELGLLYDLLQNVTHKLLEYKQKLLDQLKPEIVEFVIAVSERVIRKELSQPHTLARVIHTLLLAALPALKEDHLVIALAPEDYALLAQNVEWIQYDLRENKEIHLLSDPLVARGDCRIETKSGLLNYDIQRELSELQEHVLHV